MEVTAVTVRPVPRPRHDLLAYCSLVLDAELAVHEVHLIRLPDGADGTPGRVFLAFPSHTLRRRCASGTVPQPCLRRVRVSDRFCPACGAAQPVVPPPHRRSDDVHPVTAELRSRLTAAVLVEYRRVSGLAPDAPLPVTVSRDPRWALPHEGVAPTEAETLTTVEERHE